MSKSFGQLQLEVGAAVAELKRTGKPQYITIQQRTHHDRQEEPTTASRETEGNITSSNSTRRSE